MAFGGMVLAVTLTATAATAAVTAQDCPSGGQPCRWAPDWGISAGVVALLAVAALVQLITWGWHGRRGVAAASLLGAASVLWLVYIVAVLAAAADH
jgi:hypothetical protein